MFYLIDEVLEAAKHYANDQNSDDFIAVSCEMGVIEIEDENGEYAGRGVNIFMPTECTGDAPAFVQILITDDGELILDEGLLDHPDGAAQDFVGDMLIDQIEQARERADFCDIALAKFKQGCGRKKTTNKRKYRNAI